MGVLSWGKDGSVAVLTMSNGENRHNPVFLQEFLAALDEIEADETIGALVISSSDPKNWSQGIDINWMLPTFAEKKYQDIKGFLYGINRLFKRLLLYPLPVIAAINGHTFGNGALIACCCDFRFMKSQRGFFCFPEVDINIPFLPGMLAIMKKALPLYKLEEAILTGKRMGAQEMADARIIVRACEDDASLMADAVAFGRTFMKKRPIFGELKKRHNKAVIVAIDEEDTPYIESLAIFMK